jgi:catechol 2,3-dioxygenase-like lactoylglutathione lyase family enzyme
MDVPGKYAGYTHVALRVGSFKDTLAVLAANHINITQGPVSFGDGHVSIFVRDPDRNVIELRGRAQDEGTIGGVEFYKNEN